MRPPATSWACASRSTAGPCWWQAIPGAPQQRSSWPGHGPPPPDCARCAMTFAIPRATSAGCCSAILWAALMPPPSPIRAWWRPWRSARRCVCCLTRSRPRRWALRCSGASPGAGAGWRSLQSACAPRRRWRPVAGAAAGLVQRHRAGGGWAAPGTTARWLGQCQPPPARCHRWVVADCSAADPAQPGAQSCAIKKRPRGALDGNRTALVPSVAAATTVEGDHQAQHKDEQIDVGEVHAQGAGQVLVVAVGAGHGVKVDEGGSHK